MMEGVPASFIRLGEPATVAAGLAACIWHAGALELWKCAGGGHLACLKRWWWRSGASDKASELRQAQQICLLKNATCEAS